MELDLQNIHTLQGNRRDPHGASWHAGGEVTRITFYARVKAHMQIVLRWCRCLAPDLHFSNFRRFKAAEPFPKRRQLKLWRRVLFDWAAMRRLRAE